MKFTKMQGAGNDFVVVKTRNGSQDWSNLAVKMCDRHYGVGADGLLLLLPSKVADFKMRLFNADGSESRACGNGMRCLVKYYLDKHSNGNTRRDITIETLSGIRSARAHRQTGNITVIQANMGKPSIGHNGTSLQLVYSRPVQDVIYLMNQNITVDGHELLLSLVTVGNPHAVYFSADTIANFPLSRVGPGVEQHQLFPEETNFEVVNIINRKLVEARVWERGCGETFACGTGACAIAVAGKLLGYLDNKVEIRLPGGKLQVEWDGRGEVYLGGPASTVFEGNWS
jgi:diaminopimelate epimerase